MCGAALPDSMREDAVYCSATCQKRSHAAWRTKKRVRTCAACGQTFNAQRDDQRFCSLRCRPTKTKRPPQPCQLCGIAFKAKAGARFCSKACATKHRWSVAARLGAVSQPRGEAGCFRVP